MAMLNDDVFDAALSEISTNATVLHICSSEPASYAQVAGVSLGTKTTPTFTGPSAGDVSGRKMTVDAVPDGSVSGTDTASHWALVDGSRLLAAGTLSATQSVTTGNVFTLQAFDIEIRDPS